MIFAIYNWENLPVRGVLVVMVKNVLPIAHRNRCLINRNHRRNPPWTARSMAGRYRNGE
jgi:hypothetical protein